MLPRGTLRRMGSRRSPLSPLSPTLVTAVAANKSAASPLRLLTVQLAPLYSCCHPAFLYNPIHIRRRVLTNPAVPSATHPHDNCHGDYILRVGDRIGEQDSCFVVLALLGQGTFGLVVKCRHTLTNELVAVKIVKNRREYYQQSLAEIQVLRRFGEVHGQQSRRVVRMLGHFTFRNHLCIIFELLSSSLLDVLKQNKYRGLTLSRIRISTAQILDALVAISQAGIVHCDLKPENILMERNDQQFAGFIKVIDFGSSCFEGQPVHTYIQVPIQNIKFAGLLMRVVAIYAFCSVFTDYTSVLVCVYWAAWLVAADIFPSAHTTCMFPNVFICSPGFIGHQKSLWKLAIPEPWICGPWVASLQSSLSGNLYFPDALSLIRCGFCDEVF